MASQAPKTRRPQPGAARKPDASEPAGAHSTGRHNVAAICVAAWLLPGLGHWQLRRRWRALILFLAIVGM
ncbi:MAG: DUF6677 family protein, partial [Terriglobia bacterium]